MGVDSWGTGRPDYSRSVEYSTEPIIRGPQNVYRHVSEIEDVTANSTTTVDVDITANTVVMLYDFFLTSNKNVYITLQLQAKGTDGTYATFFKDEGYQKIFHPIPTGFPVFDSYRYRYANLSNETIDLHITINGIYTAEEEYYLTYTGPE